MKLKPQQIELLKAMQGGARVLFHPYMGRFNPSDYYRCSGIGRCTPAVRVLVRRGLAKISSKKEFSRDHEIVLTEAGKAWVVEADERKP